MFNKMILNAVIVAGTTMGAITFPVPSLHGGGAVSAYVALQQAGRDVSETFTTLGSELDKMNGQAGR